MEHLDEIEVIHNTPFNVRGLIPRYSSDTDYLLDTLKLAFLVSDHSTAEGYRIDKQLGLILYWSDKSETRETVQKFITPQTAEQVHPQVEAFLQAYYNKKIDITLEKEDEPYLNDSDITNVEGWRVYTGQWNRVNEDSYAFIAIKPAYDCYGK